MSGETKEEKTLLESMESGNEKIDAVIKTTNATIGWIGMIHKFITDYGLKKLVMDLLGVCVVVFVALWIFQPGIFSNRLDKYREARHAEKMVERMNNTPLIQAELDKFRLRTDASWVSIWELHNSTNNLDGMPFLFASLTYESMNPALTPIAEQFDNVRLSLYPLASYLREREMWYGDVEALKEVDNTAYYRAKALGINEKKNTIHFAKFKHTISGGYSRKCFTRTCCHLNECSWPCVGKRLFKVLYRGKLAIAEISLR